MEQQEARVHLFQSPGVQPLGAFHALGLSAREHKNTSRSSNICLSNYHALNQNDLKHSHLLSLNQSLLP